MRKLRDQAERERQERLAQEEWELQERLAQERKEYDEVRRGPDREKIERAFENLKYHLSFILG